MNSVVRQTERLLRMKELPQKVGIKRSTIYALIQRGEFPRPVKISERARAFRESEIDAWIAKRRAA